MKPPLFVSIHRGAIPLVSGLRKHCATLLMVAAATGLGAGVAFAQGTPPGGFYQVNPPGSGITGANYNELAWVNSFLLSGVTLFYPVSSGQMAASSQDVATAVGLAVQQLIASPGSAPAGVSLASIASQLVGNQMTIAAQIAPAGDTAAQVASLQAAAASSVVTAIASSIVANSAAPNGSNGTPALTNLNSIVTSLANAYPSTVSTFIAPIFTSAANSSAMLTYATLGTGATGNYSGISQLALAATTATTAISGNDQTIGAIVAQAINAVAATSTPGSLYTANSKQTILQNIVAAQFGSSLINSSQASIAAISESMVDGAAVAAISNPNIAAYVQAAVNALPAAGQTSVNVGAVFLGMVASGTLPEATISADLEGAAAATASEKAYLAAMNTGYTSTSANISTNLAANKGLIDAVISGAIASGTVADGALITDALSVSGSTTAIQNIVAAAITSDLVKNAADNSPTIAADAVAATTAANYAAVAQGAVGGGRALEAGTITAAMIKASPGYNAMASSVTGSFTVSNVQSLVSGALTGAYDGAYGNTDINSKTSAVAQIVYQSEVAASTFSGATAAQSTSFLPLAEAVVTQAITSMKALDTGDSNLPTYIAAAAAFAGYGGPATNLPTIQSSITTGAIGADSSAAAIAAINAVEPVVQNYRTLSSTGYTQTLAAFGTNSAAPDSVLAVLYGASLANPTDAYALLAAAISKAPGAMESTAGDSDANLLAAAINANASNQAGLTIANTVAMHIETNILANNNNDISNFVGYQVAQNPAYVSDIAAAAVAVDPNQANYVARSVAYNDPQSGYTAISSIFAYSQLTSKNNNSNPTVHIDEASAAAAIAAGYATGIVEAAQSPSMSVATVQAAFVNGVSQAVGAAISENNTRLTGASFLQAPSSLSLLPGAPTVTLTTVSGVSGVPVYSGTLGSSPAVGAAGVVTGVISQVVSPGDTALGATDGSGSNAGSILNTSASSASAIVNAILKATVFTVQNGLTTTTLNATTNGFVTQIAQAAGQAFGYITGNGTNNLSLLEEVDAADNIAGDLTTSTSASDYKLVLYAAYFGITQGQSGVEGAGASGISYDGAYSQHSATGNPVTDIFNL